MTKKSKLEEIIAPGKKVYFTHFEDRELMYVTECGLVFGVPVDAMQGCLCFAVDEARYYGSYINGVLRALEFLETLPHPVALTEQIAEKLVSKNIVSCPKRDTFARNIKKRRSRGRRKQW